MDAKAIADFDMRAGWEESRLAGGQPGFAGCRDPVSIDDVDIPFRRQRDAA